MSVRASVVIDYQNVHLTAHDIFEPALERHETLIHPVRFAEQTLLERNARQRAGYPPAELARVLVYRGRPIADFDSAQSSACQAQVRQWETDGAEVVLRDLKYKFKLGADGHPIRNIHGKKEALGPGREKGIDVLVALACLREARSPDIDLVILASRDTDLVPVLDELIDLRTREPRTAKIETVAWHDRAEGAINYGHLKATGDRRQWNTNLDRAAFEASRDRNLY